MSLFRTLAARLALVAMVAQLVIAAVHHHNLISPPSLAFTGQTQGVPAPDGSKPSSPAKSDLGDECSICLTLSTALAGAVEYGFILPQPETAQAQPLFFALLRDAGVSADHRPRAPPV